MDECVKGLHSCRQDSEACFNVAGSYKCGCQWGYLFQTETQQCVQNDDLIFAETQLYGSDTATEEKPGKPGKSPSAESPKSTLAQSDQTFQLSKHLCYRPTILVSG